VDVLEAEVESRDAELAVQASKIAQLEAQLRKLDGLKQQVGVAMAVNKSGGSGDASGVASGRAPLSC